jgi:hypothetical protein
MALSTHGLTEDGSEFGRRCAVEVAQVNFVMLAVDLFAGGVNGGVHTLNDGAFFGKWTKVERLHRIAFFEGVEADAVEGCGIFLSADFFEGVVDMGAGDELRLEDHGGPLPCGFVPLHEDARIVGPPETFERHNAVVDRAGTLLERELEGVGERIERFDGLLEGLGIVGIATAVNHEVGERRHGDRSDFTGGRLVEVLPLFFEVEFLQGERGVPPALDCLWEYNAAAVAAP